MSERITDDKLDHLIRVEDAMRCRMNSVLAADDGFSEGNVHAGVYRALVELKELRAMVARYASECGECAGVGITIDDEPCAECADIRALL